MIDRRNPPVRCRPWLALVAGALVVVSWIHEPAVEGGDSYRPEPISNAGNSLTTGAAHPTHAAKPIQGVTKKGAAFVMTRFEKGPLMEFTMSLTEERR